MNGTSRSQKGRLDMATCHLVKDVLDEHWSLETSTLRLRVLVGDDVSVLRRLRARLRRAAARRQTELTRRALATLDAVLVGYTTAGPLALVPHPIGQQHDRPLPGLLGAAFAPTRGGALQPPRSMTAKKGAA
ncbi:MAG: hypothetical protein ABSE77_04595 [Acidimicrobiales bacterium]|jgi:hypothetical protein